MPVQDNDDKRTADQPAVDAEELRRKQAQSREQQQDETSVQKSGKLLPAERKGRTSSEPYRLS